MSPEEYRARDGVALAGLVRTGQVSAAELLELALDLLDAVDPLLNVVVHRMEEEARRTVRDGPPAGPFTGVPFLMKDLLSMYAGQPTTSGSRLMRGYVAPEDSEVVRRLRAAGLVTLGKTNTPEFGLLPTTEPVAYGPTRNPWDRERTPGGSSGGSAAAVAAGVVPLAGGGDGGGSIRIPASCCGLFGLKATRGRVPTGPYQGEVWRGAAVEGVLSRSVRDSAVALDILAGPDAGAPYAAAPPKRPFAEEVGRDPGRLRVAFSAEPLLGSTVHSECRRAVEDAAALLEGLGHHVEEARLPLDGDAFARAFLTMVAAELRADVTDAEAVTGRSAGPSNLEAGTWALALMGERIPAGDYASAVRAMQRAGRLMARFSEPYDVLLTPTVAAPPPRLGTLLPSRAEALALRALGTLRARRLLDWGGLLDQAAEKAFEFAAWTPVFNMTGQPAMSLPLHWTTDGLPVGVHVVGRLGDEAGLFRLAGQVEEARPWAQRRPRLESLDGPPAEG